LHRLVQEVNTEMCTETKKLFRDRLCALQDGISNVAMARRCGLNTQDVQRYVKGEAAPTIEKLALIAKAFAVSTDWLLGISDTKTCSPLDGFQEKVSALKRAAATVISDADSLMKSIKTMEGAMK
jgi:transcriptional regulator with XRE-family HTH domain